MVPVALENDKDTIPRIPTASGFNYDFFKKREEERRKSHNEISDVNSTTLCWAEILILAEHKVLKNTTLTKEYSIIMESPDPEVSRGGKQDSDCYSIEDPEYGHTRTLNFTTFKETKDTIFKEHKTVYCGTGPILAKDYTTWPLHGRRKLEIRIRPLEPLKWKIVEDLNGTATESGPSTNFDTARTRRLPIFPKEVFEDVEETTTTSVPTTSIMSSTNQVTTSDYTLGTPHGNCFSQNNRGSSFLLTKNITHLESTQPNLLDEFVSNSEIMKQFQSKSGPQLFQIFFPNQRYLQENGLDDRVQNFYVKISVQMTFKELCVANSKPEEKSILSMEEGSIIVV